MECTPWIRRRPIYDRTGETVGFELVIHGDLWTAIDEVGWDALLGDRLRLAAPGPGTPVPDDALPTIGSGVAGDDSPIAVRVRGGDVDLAARLAAAGHPIALDQVTWNAADDALRAGAGYAVLDLPATRLDRVRAVVDGIRAHRRPQLLADGLRTRAHLAQARRLGCDLLQGDALARPVSAASLSPSRLRRVELMAALAEPDLDLDRIAAIVGRDPALAFRLLRATNSVAAGLNQRVSSTRAAIVLLGPDRVRQWVATMLVGDATEADEGQLTTAMTTARLSQLVAPRLGVPGEVAFTAGMLAGVAALIGTPVAELVDGLPLTGDLTAGLCAGIGPVGTVLAAVSRYTEGPAADRRVDPVWLCRAYLAAAAWSLSGVRVVLGSAPGRPHRASA